MGKVAAPAGSGADNASRSRNRSAGPETLVLPPQPARKRESSATTHLSELVTVCDRFIIRLGQNGGPYVSRDAVAAACLQVVARHFTSTGSPATIKYTASAWAATA